MTVVDEALDDFGAGLTFDGLPVSKGEWIIMRWKRDALNSESGEWAFRRGSRQEADLRLAALGLRVGAVSKSGSDRLGRWVEYGTEEDS